MQPWLGGRKKEPVRIILQSFIGAKYTNEFIYPIVIGLDIFITDRPVITKTVNAFSFEIPGAKAERNASPVIGSSAKHSCTPPHPLCVFFYGERFVFHCPTPVAGVKITKGPESGRSTSSW